MARQLSGRGESLALAARRTERLEALAAELGRTGGAISVHTLDVTDVASVDRVIRYADAVHGGLDVVVVNAGRGGGRRLGTGRIDRNLEVIQTNLVGALAQVETAMSLFRDRGRGHLVLVSSLAANIGLPGGSAVYSASKAALASIGDSLRAELSGTEITVTTLRPGRIRTEINAGNSPRLLTSLERGVASMIRSIDDKATDVVVPAWPWGPVSRLMPLVPARLLRRLL